MNVSIHHDGWGNYPNPQRFSNAADLRARVEAVVVRSRISERDIQPHVAAYRDCRCTIQQRVADYLRGSQKEVSNLFSIEKTGGFGSASGDNDRGFVAARLAAATSELRDSVIEAWRDSSEMSVGSPAIPVLDIENGKTNAYDAMRGVD